MHRHALRAAAVVLASLTLVAACSSGPGGIVHPSAADQLVLRIETGGGFIGPSFQLAQIPELSVFGDGRVVVVGPQIEIYPGPALPNLVTFRLSEDGLQKLLENARAAGLLGDDAHYDYPGIADAPTTTFTVVAEGRRHVVSAYALAEGGLDDARLDPDLRLARAALVTFRQRTGDIRSWLASAVIEPESAYRFEALRLFAVAAAPEPGAGIEPSFQDWPLATPLAAFGAPFGGLPGSRCGVVSGNELATLMAALQAANQLTYWRSGDEAFQLTLRPLLPDESGCPSDV